MGCVKKYGISIVWLVILLFAQDSIGQTTPISETEVRSLLEQRGIPEDTLRARLIRKGFDPDNVRPDQLDEFQAVVKTTMDEIELESRLKSSVATDTMPLLQVTVTIHVEPPVVTPQA